MSVVEVGGKLVLTGGGVFQSGSNIVSGWQTLPVGGGGFVRGLIIAADGTMVGRNDVAGAYLYNSSTSTWNQLVNVNSMPAAFVSANFNNSMLGCYELAIAPTNTQLFYMNYYGNMWISSNQGGTWTQLTGWGTKTANPNTNQSHVGQKMAVDPNNPNIVYAATDSNGMFVTNNGGATWSAVAGVPAGSQNPSVCAIVFGPASNQVGGVTQVIYACSQGNGLYKTTNGGTSWTLTSAGPTTIENAQLDASGNYWCAGNNQTQVWRYNGTTWANLTTGGGNGIQAVAVNPFNSSQVAGVDASGHITFSNDGGATWTGINQSITLVSTTIPWLGPTSTSGGSGGNFFIDIGNAIFSPVTSGKLITSSGVGVWSMAVPANPTQSTALTWNDMTAGIENMVPNEIIVPPGHGPVAAVWDRSVFYLTPGTYPSYYLPVTDDSINAAWSIDYASSDPSFTCGDVLYDTQLSGYSHDNGGTWNVFASQPTGAGGGGCIAASTPSNILFAVSGNGGSVAPSYTLNGGASWTQISIAGISSWASFLPGYPSGCWRKLCADRVTANTFYLYSSGVSSGVGIYVSTNGGASWTQQFSGYLEAQSWYADFLCPQLKAVPGNAGHLFYCSGPNQNAGSTITSPAADMYFFRSTNGGVTWTHVANVLAVSSFGFGMPKSGGGGYPAVFINGFVSGVFGFWRSDDNCATWNNIGTFAGPNGLTGVISMSGDMNNYGTCYVGLGGFSSGCSFAYYG